MGRNETLTRNINYETVTSQVRRMKRICIIHSRHFVENNTIQLLSMKLLSDQESVPGN